MGISLPSFGYVVRQQCVQLARNELCTCDPHDTFLQVANIGGPICFSGSFHLLSPLTSLVLSSTYRRLQVAITVSR